MSESILPRLHSVQVEILDEIVRICNKYNLRYCLTGGTCLGAARHQGFIPWDDDVDIIMPRKDFNKFIEVSPAEENDKFFLDYITTNPTYGRLFFKYCKKNTLFIEPNGLKQSIYVDVFVLDKVPCSDFAAKSKIPTIVHKLDALTTVRREGLGGRDKKTRMIYYLTRWIPIKWLFKWNVKLMSKYENTDFKYYINYGSPYNLRKETILISDYEPYAQLPFEGKMYNVPRNWDLYLSNIYGDYMTLPPENKRITHYPQYICFDTTNNDKNN